MIQLFTIQLLEVSDQMSYLFSLAIFILAQGVPWDLTHLLRKQHYNYERDIQK